MQQRDETGALMRSADLVRSGIDPFLQGVSFQELLVRAAFLTAASSAALALRREGQIVCCASHGPAAPELGASIAPGSLSAHCITANEIVHCTDTQADDRVDAAACRELGVGSILMVPIVSEQQAIGMLQVLAAPARAFDERHIETLQQIAAEVAALETRATPPRTDVSLPPAEKAPLAIYRNETEPSHAGRDLSKLWKAASVALAAVIVIAGALIASRMLGGSQPAAARAAEPTPIPPISEPAPPEQTNVLEKPPAVREQPAPPSKETPQKASLQEEPETPELEPVVHIRSEPIPDRPPTEEAATPAPPGLEVPGTAMENIVYVPVPAEPVLERPPASEAVAAQLIRRVEAIYPPAARAAGLQGSVVVEFTVGTDGTVSNVTVIEGNPVLARAAVDAVSRWRYRPYMLNGSPIASTMRVTINFRR